MAPACTPSAADDRTRKHDGAHGWAADAADYPARATFRATSGCAPFRE
jgi:hypothetical protein